MWGRLLLCIIFVAGLAGCATTGKTKTDQCVELQARISEMESQLDQRESEIRNLEDELSRVRGETRTADNPLVENSKPTSRNIQVALRAAGFYNGAVDGKIGKKTKEAIEEFQKANGLKADGKVGPQTWAKLKKYLE
ncbi:MAG: peptidoglycan-binding domain-containing protein [Candidatus Omnitrophota bacterium]|nr:peptidoglycan-binding protein [Candidatus Omnitrophota bacterium]